MDKKKKKPLTGEALRQAILALRAEKEIYEAETATGLHELLGQRGYSAKIPEINAFLAEINAIAHETAPQKGMRKANHERTYRSITEVGAQQHIDLLHMTKDPGNDRYMLAVVDVASRYKAAQPLEKKTAADVLKALKKIYSTTPLDVPRSVHVDDGTEFKGVFKKYLEDKGVNISVATPGDHKHTALAESLNGNASQIFFRMQHLKERGGGINKEWVKYLQDVIERLNSRRNKAIGMAPEDAVKQDVVPERPPGRGARVLKIIETEKPLKIGQVVRAPLFRPEGAGITGTQSFRLVDIKWGPQTKITDIRLWPNRPIEYEVGGRWFVRNQLQVH
jgi:transposase InsO family protein